MKPLDLLLPYQRAWVLDDSRFKVWLASRQIGKSFAVACRCVLKAMLQPSTWVVAANGERAALELLDKCKQWVRAFDLVIEWAGEERENGPKSILKSAEIRLANGSRIIALPARPDTLRGFSGNIVLDEFAFHEDSNAIWKAIYPTIANPLKGKFEVNICSTPNGLGNKFASIWHQKDKRAKWARHRVTIDEAIDAGLDIDLDELLEQAGDAETIAQEFRCQFIDGARTAFPYDMIERCESGEASIEWPGDDVLSAGPLYVGFDVGALHDPTCIVTAQDVQGRFIQRETIWLRQVALSDQDASIVPRLMRAAAGSGDAGGLGLDLCQRMVARFGEMFTAQSPTATWKREAFAHLQNCFSDRSIAVACDPVLREDLHEYQVIGTGEQARYWAPRSAKGHSDFASALAHCKWAHKTGAALPLMPHSIGRFMQMLRRVSRRGDLALPG